MDAQTLKARTGKFAHSCVQLAMQLPDNDIGRHIRRQLIRSATSVESLFWLEFAKDEGIMPANAFVETMREANELVSIFVASRKTQNPIFNINHKS